MKELTPLERRIKANALLTIRRMKDTLKEQVKAGRIRYYKFAFMCDGVVDLITFDTQTKEFEAEYYVGIGEGVSLGFDRMAAYYDNTESRTLKFKAPIEIL